MIRLIQSTTVRILLAGALMATSTAAAIAQAPEPTPEGIEWHLTAYAVEGEAAVVPWQVDATLLLEDGTATGSTGCDPFEGTYTLDGERLIFDPAVAMTRMACPGDGASVENGYMANLPLVATWTIEDRELLLADADGETVLGFEQTTRALTESDVAAIAALFDAQEAEIERLDERLDNVRIGTLRDRIKTLEAQVERLQAAAAKSGSTSTAAEKMLLKGIPGSIRGTCSPLRGSTLPRNTLAAVRCEPAASVVGEMAYYLMPYRAAERTFETVMDDHGAPERFRCHEGRASQALQSPYHATGCFADGGHANVRLISWAADCHELDVAGRRIDEPAIYIAIEGSAGRIRPLYDWATDPDEGTLDRVWRDIPHGGLPRSPGCRGLAP